MASGRLATKYGKIYADKLGIEGDFGTKGVDDITARNAFHKFMTNPDNRETGLYWNISHQLYFWHSLADVRSLEHWLQCGIRPTKDYFYLIDLAYKEGSSLPKFKHQEKGQN